MVTMYPKYPHGCYGNKVFLWLPWWSEQPKYPFSCENQMNVYMLHTQWLLTLFYILFRLHDTNQFSPAQSDTEFEVSTRPKGGDDCTISVPDDAKKALMAHRPSWRWGELPSPIPKPDMPEIAGKSEPIKERDRKLKKKFDFMIFSKLKSQNRILRFNCTVGLNACYTKWALCTQNYRLSVDTCMT